MNIFDSLRALENTPGIELAKVSSLYETEPVGAGFTRYFVNVVCTLTTVLTPEELLGECRELEARAGRDHRENMSDRLIDIDILVYGNLVVTEKDLILPHPRLHQRLFVLVPFSEIAPGWIIPGMDKSVLELKKTLDSDDVVRLISSRGCHSITLS